MSSSDSLVSLLDVISIINKHFTDTQELFCDYHPQKINHIGYFCSLGLLIKPPHKLRLIT